MGGREGERAGAAKRAGARFQTNSRQRLWGGAVDASRTAMSVEPATVQRVAGLARIAITPEEAERLAPELGNILGWIEQLGEVDTSGVAPMTAVIPNHLRLRDDVVTDGDVREKVLSNAPQGEHGFFTVPKVIE